MLLSLPLIGNKAHTGPVLFLNSGMTAAAELHLQSEVRRDRRLAQTASQQITALQLCHIPVILLAEPAVVRPISQHIQRDPDRAALDVHRILPGTNIILRKGPVDEVPQGAAGFPSAEKIG